MISAVEIINNRKSLFEEKNFGTELVKGVYLIRSVSNIFHFFCIMGAKSNGFVGLSLSKILPEKYNTGAITRLVNTLASQRIFGTPLTPYKNDDHFTSSQDYSYAVKLYPYIVGCKIRFENIAEFYLVDPIYYNDCLDISNFAKFLNQNV